MKHFNRLALCIYIILFLLSCTSQDKPNVHELTFEKRRTKSAPVEYIETILHQSNNKDTLEFDYLFADTLKGNRWKKLLFVAETKELFESFGEGNLRSLKLVKKHQKESYDWFEYEIENPAVDGDGGILFSPEIGLILLNTYSWTGSILLAESSNSTVNEYLSDSILLDSSLFINRFKFKRTVEAPSN